MKVLVPLIVDVDVQAYRDEYGSDEKPAEIRQYIRYTITDQARMDLERFSYVNSVDLNP